MPIYQYYCEKCENDFELRRLMVEIDKPALCPKCKTKGRRLVTAFSSQVGLHLKTPSKTILRQAAGKMAVSRKTARNKERGKK